MATKSNSNAWAPDGSQYVTLTDGSGNTTGSSSGGVPIGATQLSASSGNVAAGTAAATLAGAASQTTYITGFSLTSTGSTAATVVNGTITGLLGGTQTYTYASVAGATLPNSPLVVNFSPALPASAVNTSIVVSFPTLGAGNTNTTVNAYGYRV